MATVTIRAGPETLISSDAAWMYYDKATNLGMAWRALNYPDSLWGIGPAQLGFGDGDEATLIASTGKSPPTSATSSRLPTPPASPISPLGCCATTARWSTSTARKFGAVT